MNNIIEKVSKSKYFYHKPLPLPGAYMPIPSSLPGYLFQAEIQYQFNQTEYKTLPDFIEKIKKSGVVIISKNEFAVGLRYIEKRLNVPIITFKEKYTENIIQLCKENHTQIKYNKPLAISLYHGVSLGDEIPESLYEVVAGIFAKLSKTEDVRFGPHDAGFFFNRGCEYSDKKEYDKAIADYTEAIRLNPNGATSFNNRGYVYSQQEAYDQAIADYTEAIRLNPANAVFFNNRGIAYALQETYDQAMTDFSEAIRLDPNDATSFNNRGYVYAEQQAYDKAIADYEKALELTQDDEYRKIYIYGLEEAKKGAKRTKRHRPFQIMQPFRAVPAFPLEPSYHPYCQISD
ncbi:hypothetical protein AGMMS50268_38160 [Spirochaetia bacterium]|nr:hypothetical protein AGMMS50268_38160 [Spirochaetia bacterium]